MSYIIPTSAFLVQFEHQGKFLSVFLNRSSQNNICLSQDDAIKLAKETAEIAFKNKIFKQISCEEVEVSTNNSLVFFTYEKGKVSQFQSSHLNDSSHELTGHA